MLKSELSSKHERSGGPLLPVWLGGWVGLQPSQQQQVHRDSVARQKKVKERKRAEKAEQKEVKKSQGMCQAASWPAVHSCSRQPPAAWLQH